MPPEAFITVIDGICKCPGRAKMSEWPESWNPRQSMCLEERSWDLIGTKFTHSIVTHPRSLSFRTPRFLILPTGKVAVHAQARLLNCTTGRESSFTRESVTPNPADPTVTPTGNTSQQNSSAHMSQLSETTAQSGADEAFNAIRYGQHGPFRFLRFRRYARRKFEGVYNVSHCVASG